MQALRDIPVVFVSKVIVRKSSDKIVIILQANQYSWYLNPQMCLNRKVTPRTNHILQGQLWIDFFSTSMLGSQITIYIITASKPHAHISCLALVLKREIQGMVCVFANRTRRVRTKLAQVYDDAFALCSIFRKFTPWGNEIMLSSLRWSRSSSVVCLTAL